MAKVKLFTILVIIIVFGVTFDLNEKTTTEYNTDISTIDTININLDNAIIEIKATAEPEATIEVVQNKYEKNDHSIYFKNDGSILEISQYNNDKKKSIFKGFSSDKITIYIPKTKILDTLNYDVIDGKLNIFGPSIDNINISAKDIVINSSDGHFKDMNVNASIGNVYLNKDVGDQVYLNIQKGGIEIANSRFTKVDIMSLNNSKVLLDSVISNAINVDDSNNDIILKLNKDKNYNISTLKEIIDDRFSKINGGYKYQGSAEEETNNMNFSNNNIKSIDIL